MIPSPRTRYAEAAKTVLAPYLYRPSKDRLFNLFANPLPLCNIERRARLYGDDLFLAKGERNSARRTRKREIKLIGVTGNIIILSRSSDSLVKKEHQFG